MSVRNVAYRSIRISTFMLVSFFAMRALAQAFSADLVDSSVPTFPAQHNPVFVQGDRMRMEMRDPETPASSAIMLIDFAHHSALVLIPAQRIALDARAFEFARKLDWTLFRPEHADDACVTWLKTSYHGKLPAACKKTGVEMINGRVAYKYQGNGVGGLPDASFWVDQTLGILIKVDGDGARYEMQSIREGRQDASLFEVPPGYQKVGFGGGAPTR